MGFIQPGDEVIVFEPFFEKSVKTSTTYVRLPLSLLKLHRYISNIEMAGGKVVYVSLKPPVNAQTSKVSAADWKFELSELEMGINGRTKMIVC